MANLQEPDDLNNTVRVSARVHEESPYVSRYETDAMVRGVYAGRFFPIYNGEDAVHKYWVLRRKALIYDVPEKPVEISGPDAVPFLEKVVTRHVANLKEGRGRYTLACTPQGGIFMDGVLFHLSTDRYWYVQADGAFETWLLAHSGGFDVEISDPNSRVIQIQGPNAQAIMHAASDGRIDDSMKYFHAGFFELGGQEVYVSRTGFTCELGFEIYAMGEATDHLALWDHLMACGEPYGMEFSSTISMTARRVEAGILGNLTDIDTTMTPYEAGLGWVVDLDKDDFIGRDALLNADQRSLLFGLTCADALPSATSDVLDGDRTVGRMTMGVHSHTLGCGVGYVRFDKPGEWPGRVLRIRLPNDEVHDCEIVDLPFFDPEKKIARGLDRTIPTDGFA